eukprot:4361400-Pleurochrysis_carterae.AAC.1
MDNLPNHVNLCLGARVMVTHIIARAFSVLNGTVGIVHDIIVNTELLVVAVLIVVERATPYKQVYSGPSFIDAGKAAGSVNLETHAIIPIGRVTSEKFHRFGSSTRQQFPLMLAWCLTVHKAQGLTLPR